MTPRFKKGETNLSDLFKTVKTAVTARQAAEQYGLSVNRHGMACCPFHDDKSPSMKLDEWYYCFGCGVTGDAVDLTVRLLGLTPKEAALRLASDFDVGPSEDKNVRKVVVAKSATTKNAKADQERIWADRTIRVLSDYLCQLNAWEKEYAPQSMDNDDWHPLFCEALDKKTVIEYVLDELPAAGPSDYEELRHCFGKEVERIEKRLERYAGRDAC